MKDPMFDRDEVTELTHEEYVEELETLGIQTNGISDFEMRMTTESTQNLAGAFEDFGKVIAGNDFAAQRELYQALEPKSARSPKRHLQHKKAVERRKKRKRGGKK